LRLDPDFTALEFDDFGKMGDDFRRLGAQASIVRRLSEKNRQALNTVSTAPAASVAESFWVLVIEDLNRMLEDPTLWPEMRAGNAPLNHQEMRLRRYLSHLLERGSTFAEDAGTTIAPRSRRALRLLNRLIIQDLLKTHQWEKAFGLEKMNSLRWTPLLAQIDAGHDHPALLSKAGFELVQEHAALPYHRVWEFKRSR
jgi:hypothetical protein